MTAGSKWCTCGRSCSMTRFAWGWKDVQKATIRYLVVGYKNRRCALFLSHCTVWYALHFQHQPGETYSLCKKQVEKTQSGLKPCYSPVSCASNNPIVEAQERRKHAPTRLTKKKQRNQPEKEDPALYSSTSMACPGQPMGDCSNGSADRDIAPPQCVPSAPALPKTPG